MDIEGVIDARPSKFHMVDSENTLTDISSIQKRLAGNNNDMNTNNSFGICLEKTVTHHSFYDVEKLAESGAVSDNTMENPSYNITSSTASININSNKARILGMGNPGIIGTWGFATVTMLMALHKLILPADSNHLMLPTALMYGGLAQFLSGFLVLLTGDSFNGTLFVTFGAYWLGSGLMMVPSVGSSLDVYTAQNQDATVTAIYLFLWSFFGLMVCGISIKIKNGTFLGTWCLFFVFLNLFLEACYFLTGIVSLMIASGVACICASVGAYYSGIVDLFAEQGVVLWNGKYKQ